MPGRPISKREQAAVQHAMELLETTKNNGIKTKLIELILKADQSEKERRDAAAERREQRLNQTAELQRLKAENAQLRFENKQLREEVEALKRSKPETPKAETDAERARRLLAMPSATSERGPRSHPQTVDSVRTTQTESVTSGCAALGRADDTENPSLHQNTTLQAIREANRPVPPMPGTPREQAIRERDSQSSLSMELNPGRMPTANPIPEEEEADFTASLPDFNVEDVISEKQAHATRHALLDSLDKLLG